MGPLIVVCSLSPLGAQWCGSWWQDGLEACRCTGVGCQQVDVVVLAGDRRWGLIQTCRQLWGSWMLVFLLWPYTLPTGLHILVRAGNRRWALDRLRAKLEELVTGRCGVASP